MGSRVRIFDDFLELEMVSMILLCLIILRFLCEVLFGCIKKVDVFVLVKVVVIFLLIWFDLFIFIIMILFV